MRVEEERPTRADPSPPDPFLGQILGGCRIDEVLGRGGMGVVYKATQLSLNRPVAIKVLPEEVCGQPQFVERFKREVDVLSRLSHPNVVTVLERGEVDGRLYVIMEYVQGTSLREVMRKGPLPAAEALLIVRGVLAALEHAHGKGIIHRDIKPENVLVAPGGIVKVADFGLSRLLDPGPATRLTHTNLLLGTFEYMAPEQRERAKEADERADIYATGVVLYEMLAGELPIGHFAALSRKRPRECDSRIDEIVERSLAKAPDDRYQRASEMGAAVSRVLSAPAAMAPPAPEQPAGASPRPPDGAAGLLQTRTRVRVGALVVGALVFTAALTEKGGMASSMALGAVAFVSSWLLFALASRATARLPALTRRKGLVLASVVGALVFIAALSEKGGFANSMGFGAMALGGVWLLAMLAFGVGRRLRGPRPSPDVPSTPVGASRVPPPTVPHVHIAERYEGQPRGRARQDDPARAIGCLVFLVALIAGLGLLRSALVAVVALLVVRALPAIGVAVKGVVLAVIAVVVVLGLGLFVFLGGTQAPNQGAGTEASEDSPDAPPWLGRPDVTRMGVSDGWIFANRPLGLATAALPRRLGRDFLDDERIAWLKSVVFVPFDVQSVSLAVVEGKVVASLGSPIRDGTQTVDSARLRRFWAALAIALERAYPDGFVRDASAADLPYDEVARVAATNPPPGPDGEWAFDVATNTTDVSDELANAFLAQVPADSRVRDYLTQSCGASPTFPEGVRLEWSRGKVRAVLQRRVYADESAAERVAVGLGKWVCQIRPGQFRETPIVHVR